MQNPYYEHKPDPLEKKVRFGCGFLFGLLVGFFEAARYLYRHYPASMLTTGIVVGALICGWLAMRYGDRFWFSMLGTRWWR